MKPTDFATLADAHAYYTVRRIPKSEVVDHDVQFGVEAILDDLIAEITAKSIITNEDYIIMRSAKVFRKIINGILDDVDVLSPTVQMAMFLLVSEGEPTAEDPSTGYRQYMRDAIEAKAKVFPFSGLTQEQFDEAHSTLNIQKEECTYPTGMNYIITAPNEGVDIDINTDIDCFFVAYLMVCADTADQNDISHYSPVNGDNPVSIPVKSINGKATIALSNRKVRGFNKLFIKPSKPCIFTASAKANRG